MIQTAWAQAWRRKGRSMAVISAIVVASVSFAILSSAVATSRLRVQGTVNQNFRTAYDILVRPAQAATALERTDGLVQENYLSGIYGGITLQQYREIAQTPGVEVAAPVAMIGYVLPAVAFGVKVDPDLTSAPNQLFAVKRTWTTDRGLSHVPDRSTYIYFTRHRVSWDTSGQVPPIQKDPLTGKPILVCQNFAHNMQQRPPRSAFDVRRLTELTCAGSNPPEPGRTLDQFPHGQTGFVVYYQFPMLVAAIDPLQEARLVGLDKAVVRGRYLTEADKTRKVRSLQQVPVLMAARPLTDDVQTIKLQRLAPGSDRELLKRLSAPNAPAWLAHRPAQTLRTLRLSDRTVYHRLLATYAKNKPNAQVDYWSTQQVKYRRDKSGTLHPIPVPHAPPRTYFERAFGTYYAPQVAADRGFRGLQAHQGSNAFNGSVYGSPTFHQVGVFDPTKIEGFSPLSRVPLTTYYAPDAAPGDARTRRLLHGRSLQPNANLAGYLQQPPMMLTTIRSLHSFLDSQAFTGVSAQEARAPISVIRVRIAGVTGADSLSRARVRVAAERIARETGLTVDITIGSSPRPEQVDLPSGSFGRPPLTLTEGWVKKGVTVQLLSAVDKKSLAMFGLVLLVCGLFLLNATVAAVRTRRAELGVLACVGWSARHIFVLLETELLVTGLAAGTLGTVLALGLTASFGLQAQIWHLALITPIATLLSGLAGIGPAWRASHTTPVEAIQPSARAPRKAGNVTNIAKLASVGVRRWPGRTTLGAASLFIGVAALAILIAVQQAFRGNVTGTALGNVVAIQVRGVDYVAAVLTIALGAFAVADIAYLNISERTSEIGTLRATGWSEGHIRTLFGIEALLTSSLGALSGAILGVGIASAFLPIALDITVTSAFIAAVGGVVASMVAVSAPLSRLNKLAPSAAVAGE